jgi:hypothetical protein
VWPSTDVLLLLVAVARLFVCVANLRAPGHHPAPARFLRWHEKGYPMTLTGWLSASYVVAFGLTIASIAVTDVWLVQSGRPSITDHLRALALDYEWLPVVSTALITAAVVLLLGLVIGHLWLT